MAVTKGVCDGGNDIRDAHRFWRVSPGVPAPATEPAGQRRGVMKRRDSTGHMTRCHVRAAGGVLVLVCLTTGCGAHASPRLSPRNIRPGEAAGQAATRMDSLGRALDAPASTAPEPADADPREFLLAVDMAEVYQPLELDVFYYACDDALTFCIPVNQSYRVHLERDHHGLTKRMSANNEISAPRPRRQR